MKEDLSGNGNEDELMPENESATAHARRWALWNVHGQPSAGAWGR